MSIIQKALPFFHSVTIGSFIVYFSFGIGTFNGVCFAQAPDPIWEKTGDGLKREQINSSCTDALGNVYVAGSYTSPTLVLGGITLTNQGGNNGTNDIFIAKYNSNGLLLWAKSAGGTSDDFASSVILDIKSGFVFICGNYLSPTISFNVVLTNPNIQKARIYVAIFNPTNGAAVTAKDGGGANSNAMANSLTSDASGNIYLVGQYNGASVSISGMALPVSGLTDAFLAKYNFLVNVFTFQWVRTTVGAGNDFASAVTVDGTDVYLTGVFDSHDLSFASLKIFNGNGVSKEVFFAKYSSSGVPQWAKAAGGTGDDISTCITKDGLGKIWVGGYFSSPVLNFPASNALPLTNLAQGTSDVFLAKIQESDGKALSAVRAGGTDADKINSVCADASGKIYAAGSYKSSSILFGANNLVSSGSFDIFLAKYDNNAVAIWGTSSGGSSEDGANTVSRDINGNIYVGGYFTNSIIFCNEPINSKNPGFSDIILIKYAEGVPWVTSMNGGLDDSGEGIATDASGNVFVVGYFTSPTLTISTNINTIILNNANPYSTVFDPNPHIYGSKQMFLAKYNSNGTVIWAKTAISSGGANEATCVATDSQGNIYIAGDFWGPKIVFDNLPQVLHTPGAFGDTWDMFVAKYDPNGNPIWVKHPNGIDDDWPYSICVDNSTNIFVSGMMNESIDFGNGKIAPVSGDESMFIVKLNSSGTAQWAKGSQLTCSNPNFHCKSYAFITNDISGNIYAAGGFSADKINFDNVTSLVGQGTPKSSAFLVKYDNNGNVKWAQTQTGNAAAFHSSVSADQIGNIYVGGSFHSGNNVKFGNTPSLAIIDPCCNTSYVLKYNNTGVAVWAKGFGGTGGAVWPNSISATPSGNRVMVAGEFLSTSITVGISTIFSSNMSNLYIAQFDGNVNGLFVSGATNMVQSAFDDRIGANSIKVDEAGNVFVTGRYAVPQMTLQNKILLNTSLDPNPDQFFPGDVFVARYKPTCTNPIGLKLAGSNEEKMFSLPEVSNSDKGKVAVYPNPNTGVFNLQLESGIDEISILQVFNILGEQCYSENIHVTPGENIFPIKTNTLKEGIYFLQVTNTNNKYMQKISIKP